jgi:hypothetical protein
MCSRFVAFVRIFGRKAGFHFFLKMLYLVTDENGAMIPRGSNDMEQAT